ncbi:MAG: hypothetical protein H7Y17_14620 [Chlorobia bacterium]|nr:hypothetical protein [Fimbriimonadaceae bacterium]
MSLEVQRVFGVGAWRTTSSVSRRRFGVPPGGPWNREAAGLALALVGKKEVEPVFELLQGSATILAKAAGSLAVIGQSGTVTVRGQSYLLSQRISVEAGDVIHVQAHYAYLAYANLDLPQVRIDFEPPSLEELRFIRSVEGEIPQVLIVDPASNRAGTRLNGMPPAHQPEQPSEPCCVGTIQQTPSGQLIVIGPDGPTIGGYPKLGSIIEADLDLIPSLNRGQQISLKPIAWEQAVQLSIDREARIISRLSNLSVIQVLPAIPVQIL